jgi:hypothetical protein
MPIGDMILVSDPRLLPSADVASADSAVLASQTHKQILPDTSWEEYFHELNCSPPIPSPSPAPVRTESTDHDNPVIITARDLVHGIMAQPSTTPSTAEALLELVAAHEQGFYSKNEFLAQLRLVADARALLSVLRIVAETSDDSRLKAKICGVKREHEDVNLHTKVSRMRCAVDDMDIGVTQGTDSSDESLAAACGAEAAFLHDLPREEEEAFDATDHHAPEPSPSALRRPCELHDTGYHHADGIRRSGRSHASSAAADVRFFF